MTIEEVKQKVTPILQDYGVEYAGVFGSVARGDARPDSDIDLLVKFQKPVGLFRLMHFEDTIQDVLQKKVDVLTEGGVNAHLRTYINKDLQIIYGQR